MRRLANQKKIIYILGCRAGIFLPIFRPLLKKAGLTILVNPDGAEWRRAKWNFIAKKVIFFYELCLVKYADLIVCDSISILNLIHKDFNISKRKMIFIAYGAEVYREPVELESNLKAMYETWLENHQVGARQYYLMVGRFVPENNYELIIKDYIASDTKLDLIIISNIVENKFYKNLERATGHKSDGRIKFIGTVYDQDLLKVIRSRARAYIHGHEVGGTNPSLLEALGATSINLVYDVSFNREVAEETALYFTKEKGSLASKLVMTDSFTDSRSKKIGLAAKYRIEECYSWPEIFLKYESLFISLSEDINLAEQC